MALGLIGCGQMRSFAIAGVLARATGTGFKSALKRFYRWVHNEKLDDLACWSALADRLLAHAGRRPLVAVDWTEWHSGLRVPSAAVCVGARAVPVRVQAFSKSDMPRSQNTRENTFVQLLVRLSPHMQRAVPIFDRGFRRVSLIRELGWLSQPFIIRLAAKVQGVGEPYTGLLSQHPLQPGQRVDLGVCALGQAKPVRVRVIGVWAQGQDEPWWLATTLTCSARRVAAYYDRRMGIEEHFRDCKGCRYGIKLKWTAFTDPAALARLFLLAVPAGRHRRSRLAPRRRPGRPHRPQPAPDQQIQRPAPVPHRRRHRLDPGHRADTRFILVSAYFTVAKGAASKLRLVKKWGAVSPQGRSRSLTARAWWRPRP